MTGYTDKADGSAASTTGTLAAACDYCLTSTHAYNALPSVATKCVVKANAVAAGLCLAGYTDKSDGSAATAAGGTIAGDCKYCVSSTH